MFAWKISLLMAAAALAGLSSCARDSDGSLATSVNQPSLCDDPELAPSLGRIDTILSAASPWPTSFDFSHAKFLVHKKQTPGALAKGFSTAELAAAGFTATPCTSRPDYQAVVGRVVPD